MNSIMRGETLPKIIKEPKPIRVGKVLHEHVAVKKKKDPVAYLANLLRQGVSIDRAKSIIKNLS